MTDLPKEELPHQPKYIFNDIEVKKTGRVATRTTTKRTKEHRESKVEITPTNISEGSWKKWVEINELFTIT